MHQIIDFVLDYSISVAFAISLALFILRKSKLESYLKLNYYEIHRKIYFTKQDDRMDGHKWQKFTDFISTRYLELNDKIISEIVLEYKAFRLSTVMLSLLFFAKKAISNFLES